MKPKTPQHTPQATLLACLERSDPAERKLLEAVRAALRRRMPTANEIVYDYRTFFVLSYSPTDMGIDGIVSLTARDDGVRLYFGNGPQLPDPKSLLQGAGKQTRYLLVEAAGRLQDPEVEALIAAAIEHARVPLPAAGKGKLLANKAAARPRAGKPSKQPSKPKKPNKPKQPKKRS